MKAHVFLLLLLPLVGCAARGTSQLARMLAVHDQHAVQVSMLVVDLDSGETVFAREPQRLCRPASTQKLLTTAAICRRDVDGAFVTKLSANALPAGIVTLTGAGDPLLTSEEIRELVQQLRALGLNQAAAEVRVVDALRDAPRFGEGWMWDDEPDSFAPALAAASVDAGCVVVEVRQQGSALSARLLPVAGALRLRLLDGAHAVAVSRGRYRDADLVTVTGRIHSDSDEQPVERHRITVPVPARYAGHVLADALQQAAMLDGEPVVTVALADSSTPQKAEVELRRSVADVVIHTNKVSDNLGAEMLLRRLGTLGQPAIPLGPAAQPAGVAAVAADLQQLGFAESSFRIADGSGVSHYNLISADLLVRLLVSMQQLGGHAFDVFYESLPIGGVDGTLASRMQQTAAHGRVHAKTGTVSAVSNLGGYIETRTGRRFAFAILCQNFVGSPGPWRDLQDALCAVLADM